MNDNTFLLMMCIGNAFFAGFAIGNWNEHGDEKEDNKLIFRMLFYGAFTVYFAFRILGLMDGTQ